MRLSIYGSRLATREHHELKDSGGLIYAVGEPGTWINIHTYIDSQLGSAQDPPPTWTGSVSRRERENIIQKLTDDKKGDSTGFGQGQLTLPPYWMMTLLPQCSTRIEAACAVGAQVILQQPLLLPALPEVVERHLGQALIPVKKKLLASTSRIQLS